MSKRTILQILPAPDMHIIYFDAHDPDDWGVCPLCAWALVEGPLIHEPRKRGRYVVGMVALDVVDFADCLSDAIEYVATADLPEARVRAAKRAEREKERAA